MPATEGEPVATPRPEPLLGLALSPPLALESALVPSPSLKPGWLSPRATVPRPREEKPALVLIRSAPGQEPFIRLYVVSGQPG